MTEAGDGLDHLRIPFEKIKFGKKIEVQGYGTVFEGEIDDQRVALKQLNITNLANIKPKLLAEILTISRFRHHPNLVALQGFCDEKTNEIILVYEYVGTGNLADKMRKRLTTIQRLEICLGAARGLDYLHTGVDPTTPGIVHGNIKPSKILLNSDANSSKLVAKVSSFGLSKIVPGKATLESSDEVTEKPTKESDVYSFGVLLLEVLCGVSELVDTDDYQERHVAELVPKKMQQNKLRKVVHFDIRKEIKTESLETYAKIACQCVMENPDERPQMAQVVEQLEKALRLQGGEVTYVQIPTSRSIVGESIGGNDSNDVINIQSSEKDVKDLIAEEGFDDAGEDNSYKNNTLEDTRTLGQSFSVPDSGSNNVESVLDVAEKENSDKLNDSESVEKITVIDKLSEKSKIMGENEVSNETTTLSSESDSGNESNSVVGEKVSDSQLLASSNGSNEPEKTEEESKQEYGFPLPDENDNVLMINTCNPHTEEIMEAQNSTISNDNAKAELLNTEKHVLIVNTREGFSNSATQTQKSGSKRSDSTCSESSTGDDTTPSDHLLPKSPYNMKETSRGSRTCSCCCCSLWQFISDRVVLYGGQFWNKLVSFFTWITGQCSSKRD